MQQPWLTPGSNRSVKLPSTMSSIIFFFFSSLCSLLPPHFPAVVFRPASMYHISLCFSCVALFEPGVRGEIKQTPILKLTGSLKSEPEGSTSPPFQPSPSLTEAASDKGAVCYKLLGEGGVGGGNTTGRVIWCSFDPLSPPRWKGFQFYQTRKTTSAQNPLRASKLSRIFNRRQITVYCGMCALCSIAVAYEGKGAKIALSLQVGDSFPRM